MVPHLTAHVAIKVLTNQPDPTPRFLKRTLNRFQWALLSMGGHVSSFDPFSPTIVWAVEGHVRAGGVMTAGQLLWASVSRDGLVCVLVSTVLTGVPPKAALTLQVFPEVLSIDPLGLRWPR